jgi:hypothetical protein
MRKSSAESRAPASFQKEAEATAEKERAIQLEIDRAEAKSGGKSKESGPMQAGARRYPVPPLPEQHLEKPGSEAELVSPRCMTPRITRVQRSCSTRSR